MTTFTREWLQQTIADFESTRDDAPFGLDEDDAKILAALKLALAAMQQEPAPALRAVGVMSEAAFHKLEKGGARFIALWPCPERYSPRKRPEDGVIVYARTASADSIKGSE